MKNRTLIKPDGNEELRKKLERGVRPPIMSIGAYFVIADPPIEIIDEIQKPRESERKVYDKIGKMKLHADIEKLNEEAQKNYRDLVLSYYVHLRILNASKVLGHRKEKKQLKEQLQHILLNLGISYDLRRPIEEMTDEELKIVNYDTDSDLKYYLAASRYIFRFRHLGVLADRISGAIYLKVCDEFLAQGLQIDPISYARDDIKYLIEMDKIYNEVTKLATKCAAGTK